MRRVFHGNNELLQAKRHFMRFVSHEVRTPMNSVCMGLGIIRQEIASTLGFQSAEELQMKRNDIGKSLETGDVTVSGGQALEWFGLAQDVLVNSQTAVDVLSDMLDFDKVESNNLQLELTEISIWELVVHATNEFKLPAENKNITFDLSLMKSSSFRIQDMDVERDPEQGAARFLPRRLRDRPVIGDSKRLTQVVRNLCSNAIKFSPQGSQIEVQACWRATKPKGRKTFKLKDDKEVTVPRGGEIQISVTDHGVGMTEEQLAKLFRAGTQFNPNELQVRNFCYIHLLSLMASHPMSLSL